MSGEFFQNRKQRFKPMVIGNNRVADRSQPEPSAVVHIDDINGGFLPPRLTTAQRNAIVQPAEGLMIYNLDTSALEIYNTGSTSWAASGGGGGGAVASVFGRTGAIVSANGDYTAAQVTNVPAGNLTATDVQGALNELQADIDAIPDEMIENAGALTGAAPVGAQWGVDTTTGQAYYVSGGNWTAMPVTTVDLNMTVSNQAGNNAGAAPLAAPAGPDTGDIHLEVYDDFLVWWSWNGTAWTSSAQVATNPALATNISPAATDGTGAVGTSAAVAREDHKHPAQAVSADAEQLLKAGTDGLHMLDPDDLVSADAGNSLVKGSDAKLKVIGVPTAANAIPPAATDATGAIGTTTTEYALEDHKHPAQGVSANANNILTIGTDGLHHLPLNASAFSKNLATTDNTLQKVADKVDALVFGKNRSFADNTTVAPAAAGAPTLAEITTFATNASVTDTVLYYTGTDLSTDAPTYVYHVDNAGVVTLIEKPTVTSSTYITTFNATTDWGTAGGGFYTITVPAATHGITTPNSVDTWEDDGAGNFTKTTVELPRILSNNDITISVSDSPDGRFAGRVVIR